MEVVADQFNGTTAERLVLLLFAMKADKETGITHPTCTIDRVAQMAGMPRTNVRRIVRKYERALNDDSRDGWLYVVSRQAKQGDVLGTVYRMPMHPQIPPKVKRAPRNPDGINVKGGLQKPPRGVTETPLNGVNGGLQEPPRGVNQSPKGGYRNPPRGVTVTHSSRDSNLVAPGVAGSGPEVPEVRQSRPSGTPLDVWIQSGASPQTPKQPAGDGDPIGIADRSPAPPEATDDESELALITDHQPPLDPIP